jgi:hypothetical protein
MTEPTDDPHGDDFCVVCMKGVRKGVTMYPVTGIDNGCVCAECIDYDELNAKLKERATHD